MQSRPRGRGDPRHTVLTSAEPGPGPDASVRIPGPAQGARGHINSHGDR